MYKWIFIPVWGGNYVAPRGVCLTLVIWSSLEHVKSGLMVEHAMEYELSQDLNWPQAPPLSTFTSFLPDISTLHLPVCSIQQLRYSLLFGRSAECDPPPAVVHSHPSCPLRPCLVIVYLSHSRPHTHLFLTRVVILGRFTQSFTCILTKNSYGPFTTTMPR